VDSANLKGPGTDLFRTILKPILHEPRIQGQISFSSHAEDRRIYKEGRNRRQRTELFAVGEVARLP
jgi:hypothetical protein